MAYRLADIPPVVNTTEILLNQTRQELKTLGVYTQPPEMVVKHLESLYPQQRILYQPAFGKNGMHYIDYITTQTNQDISIDPRKPTIIRCLGFYEDIRAGRLEAHLLSKILHTRVLVVDYAHAGGRESFFRYLPQFLQANGVKGKIIPYGTSLGGLIAQDMASHASTADRVQALVVTQSALPDSQQFAGVPVRFLETLYQNQESIPTALMNGVYTLGNLLRREKRNSGVHTMTGEDEKLYAIHQATKSLIHQDRSGKLSRHLHIGHTGALIGATEPSRGIRLFRGYKGKSLFVHVTGDLTVRPERKERIVEMHPQARVLEIDESYGHATQVKRFMQVFEPVIDFLQEVS